MVDEHPEWCGETDEVRIAPARNVHPVCTRARLLLLPQPAPARTASERPRRAPQYGYLPAHLVAAFGGRAEVVQRIYDTYPERRRPEQGARAGAGFPPPPPPLPLDVDRPPPPPRSHAAPPPLQGNWLPLHLAACWGNLEAAEIFFRAYPEGAYFKDAGACRAAPARPTPPAARAPRLPIRQPPAAARTACARSTARGRWGGRLHIARGVEGKPYDDWRAAHPELAALDDDHAPGLNGSNGAGPSTPSGRSERAADDLARLTIKIDEEEKVVQDEYEEQGTWADLPNDDPAYVAPPPPVDPRTQVPGRGPGSSGSGPNRGHFR